MWLVLAVLSAALLGFYDVAKKQALRKNGTFAVLLGATALSTLFLCPFFRIGPLQDHLKLALKAVLVTASWVSGMEGLKRLPLTTVSTIKGSRPVFVVLFSVLLFGERLGWMQWLGIVLVLGSLYLLGFTSRSDGTVQARKTGFVWMGVSVVTGVLSALFDKHIMQGMEPLFVQSWTNLYITIILALCILVKHFVVDTPSGNHGRPCPFKREGPAPSGVGGTDESKSFSVVDTPSGNHGRPCPFKRERPASSGVGGTDESKSFSVVDTPSGNHGRPWPCEREGPAPSGVGGMSEAKFPEGVSTTEKFVWDWTIVLVAVLITGADAMYFFALKQPDALLSVISVVRRASVLVSFILGAVLFKEGNVRAKSLNMALMAAGVVLLLAGSS